MSNSSVLTNDDDSFNSQFDCNAAFLRQFHVNVSVINGGNFFIGLSKLLAFVIIFVFNAYNRYLLAKKHKSDVYIIRGLVLPSYFVYIYIFLILSIVSGTIDILIHNFSDNPPREDVWLIPIETGLFHCLFEGLAFFLMRRGAGVEAIYYSLSYGLLWGFVTSIVFFVIYAQENDQYEVRSTQSDADVTIMSYLLYSIVVLLFYLTFLVVPVKYLYRRPALIFYARFNVLYQSFFIIVVSLVYGSVTESVCVDGALALIFVAILQPVVIFRTLQIDSDYWQGLFNSGANPMADVWDHVNIETASSMAANLDQFHRGSTKLPVIHFGMLKFENKAKFVSGGFSRVYFGTFNKEKVAFKILFAMELTPSDVQEFYKEAATLYQLRHENVVRCKGVSVMPPSMILVLEYCKYGSLFDFLYKPRRSKGRTSDLNGLAHFNQLGSNSSEAERDSTALTLSTLTEVINENLSMRMTWMHTNDYTAQSNLQLGNNKLVSWSINPIIQQHDLAVQSSSRIQSTPANERGKAPLEVEVPVRRSMGNSITSTGPSIGITRESNQHSKVQNPDLKESLISGDNFADLEQEQRTESIATKPPLNMKASTSTRDLRIGDATHSPMQLQIRLNSGSPDNTDMLQTSTNANNNNDNNYSYYKGINKSSSNEDIKQRLRTSSDNTINNSKQHSIRMLPSNAVSGALEQLSNLMTNSFLAGSRRDRDGSFSITSKIAPLPAPNEAANDVNQLPLAFSLTLEQRLVMMRDCVCAIEFLHSKGFMHCDIKSLNFLVDQHLRLKLADMGEARRIDSKPTSKFPPIPARNWAPPEVLSLEATADAYTVKSDIYGLSLVLSELILMDLPFGDLPERVNPRKWLELLTVDNIRPILPQAVPQTVRTVVERGWNTNPELRPTASELLQQLDLSGGRVVRLSHTSHIV